MTRPARKRAFATANDEPNLYEQEAQEAEDNAEDYAPDGEEGDQKSNGAQHGTKDATELPALEVLETADEDELRGIISNIDDVVEVLLIVPEWQVPDPTDPTKKRAVQVMIRSLTSFERTQFIKAMQKGGGDIDFTKMYADLVILSTRHPKTKRLLFKNADRAMLNGKAGSATERIALRAADISKLSEDALKEMRKNW